MRNGYLVLVCGLLAACVSEPASQEAIPAADVQALSSIPGDQSILFVRGAAQVAVFRNQSQLAPARAIEPSAAPLALPAQLRDLSDATIASPAGPISLDDYLARNRVAGLLVVKDGNIAFEYYGLGNDAQTRWISFSVAKSVVSLLVGAAIADGYIHSVEEKVSDYLPRLKGSPYEDATIAQLLQMSTGVAWNEDYTDPNSDVASADYQTLKLYQHLRGKERVAPPGGRFNYNTAETNLAGNLLRSAIGNNLATYLQNKIWQPFGMESRAHWQLTEPAGGEFGGCCINATLRDYARIGLFALADGRLADGTRVLPEGWMKQSTTPADTYAGYGYFWWLSDDGAYRASGIFGQSIYVNPEENVVIAVHSAWDNADADADWEQLNAVYQGVVQALR